MKEAQREEEYEHIMFDLRHDPQFLSLGSEGEVAETSTPPAADQVQKRFGFVRYGTSSTNHSLPPEQSFPVNIPRHLVKTIQHTDLCSICLNPLKTHPSLNLKCGHIFHTACISDLEHHSSTNHDKNIKVNPNHQQHATCPLCRTDYPSSAEKSLIEGCRIFFILKSNVEFGGRPSQMWEKAATKRREDKEEMIHQWKLAAQQGNDRAMENLAHVYNHGDCAARSYEQAAYWYKKQADKGNPRAQFRLGRAYNFGQFYEQNHAKAADLYLKAAKQGYPKAQVAYAKLLFDGKGVKKNVPEAEKWITEAAERGSHEAKLLYADYLIDEHEYDRAQEVYSKEAEDGVADAQFNLGVMYLNGDGGVEMDQEKAALYFLLAADQNHMFACNCLGHMFQDGLGGCLQSDEQALEWFDKAAAQGCIDSQLSAAALHLKIKTSGTNTETNEEVAERLTREAANHGSAEAQLRLGKMLEKRHNGSGDKPMDWYVKAARNGDIEAMMLLGDMFFYGRGVEVCYKVAGRWYKAAANLNCGEAQKNLGYMFYNGLGVPAKSMKEALRWYILAAENNNAKAQYYLAKMYIRGLGGVEECFSHAAFWLKKSAALGDAGAQFYLARLYSSGQGVPESLENAIEWATKASQQGHDGARDLLAVLLQDQGGGAAEEGDAADDSSRHGSKGKHKDRDLKSSLEIPSETKFVIEKRKTLL